MEKSRAEIWAGAVVVISLVLLSFMIFLISDIADVWKTRKRLVIHFNRVSGIMVGSPVRYAGIDKGKVVKLKQNEMTDPVTGTPRTEVLVFVDIDEDVVLRVNDRPEIVELITGTQWIDIVSKTGDLLKPNEKGEFAGMYELQGRPVTALTDILADVGDILDREKFAQILASLQQTVDNAKKISEDVKTIVAESRDSFRKSMESLEHTTARVEEFVQRNSDPLSETITELRAVVAENRETVRKAVENFESLGTRLNELVQANEGEVGKAVQDVTEFAERLRGIGERAEGLLANADKVLAENRVDLHRAVVLIKESAAELRLGIEEVRRSPWRLLHRPDASEVELQDLYDSVRAINLAAASVAEAAEALKDAEGEDAAALRERLAQEMTDLEKARSKLFDALVGAPRER
ncbi:MAG: MlaD family protein [Planctomycetota bacterium]